MFRLFLSILFDVRVVLFQYSFSEGLRGEELREYGDVYNSLRHNMVVVREEKEPKREAHQVMTHQKVETT